MNINLSDYISDHEIKEIVRKELQSAVSSLVRKDIERIINNSAYSVVWDAVDKVFDNNAKDVLSSKVVEIIESMGEYSLFRKPDAWDRTENQVYGILKQCVKDNMGLLDTQVKNKMSTLSKTEISKIASDVMKERLSKSL